MKLPIQNLNQLTVFASAKPETRQMLFASGQIRRYDRGRIFHQAWEPVDYLYIQLEGRSIVYNLTHAGQRRILFIFGPGDVLNLGFFTARSQSLHYEALTESRVLAIPRQELTAAMCGDSGLAMALMEEQERKLLRLSHQMKNTAGSIYMDRRLAAKLWKLARDFGVPDGKDVMIDIELTVTLLADLLGAPRETVSRACRTLTQKGLIRMTRRQITVLDVERIKCYFRTGGT